MSRFISRVVVVGLAGGLALSVAAQLGMAGTQQRAASEGLLAQAGPDAPPAQNIEANIASLHQRLQISPAQEAQFNALANVMRQNARAETSVTQAPPPSASAVEYLRAEIQYDELELAGLKRFLPALEALYATLSPAQRQIANAIFREGPGG
jgi:protein CpxP